MISKFERRQLLKKTRAALVQMIVAQDEELTRAMRERDAAAREQAGHQIVEQLIDRTAKLIAPRLMEHIQAATAEPRKRK